MAINGIQSTSGIYSGTSEYVALRRRNFSPLVDRGILVYHGAGGEWEKGTPTVSFSAHDEMLRVVAAQGFVVMALNHGAHTWGNDASLTLVSAAVTFLQGTLQAAPGRIGHMAGSMGNVLMCNYAKRNPTKIAAMVGVIPASSLAYHFSGNDAATGKFQTEINAAYAGDYTVNGPDTARDPTLFGAVDLPTFRYGLFYNSDDPAVPSSTVIALHAAINNANCTIANAGTGGHNGDTLTPELALPVLYSGNWS